MNQPACFFIVTGISGVGKSTLVTMLLEDQELKQHLARVVTYTTRLPRAYEKQGIDYHFITEQEFLKKIQEGFFIEYKYSHHYYGTSQQVMDNYTHGVHQIIVVDPPGAVSFKKLFPDAYILYISASESTQEALDITHQRLLERGSEDEASLAKRLAMSSEHLLSATLQKDYELINDDLYSAFKKLRYIVCGMLKK